MKLRAISTGVVLVVLAMVGSAVAQKDADNEPTAVINFLVVKDENGKPIRNAAIILHPVNTQGRQGRGGLELKSGPEGKSNFDGLPYGKVRVQVLAHGYQTYGEDFDVNKPTVDVIIKLKRPQGQYSVYEDHPNEASPPAKEDPPPAEASEKKPN